MTGSYGRGRRADRVVSDAYCLRNENRAIGSSAGAGVEAMRIRRPLVEFTTVVLVLLTQAGVIQAQDLGKKVKPIEPRAPSCPECVPHVLADPDGGVFTDTTALEVAVYFCDNAVLGERTRWYKLNGTTLSRTSFTWESDDGGCPAGYAMRKKSVGTESPQVCRRLLGMSADSTAVVTCRT